MSARVGVDVGGTFTDLVAVEPGSGAFRSKKVLTTPEAPAQGVLQGLLGLAPDAAAIAHGTTIVTNAVVEGKGARTALVTTRGFRDVLEIARQSRLDLYRLDIPPRPAPLVPRHLRLEVTERVAGDGRVLTPLAEGELPGLVAALRAAGVEAVAVCLLHAYAHPEHEARVRAALASAFPYVSASHEINAEFREYERTATTVLNAAVMPLAERYLADLEAVLARVGFRGPLHLLQSNGAMMSAEAARRRPLAMAVSGPAGGVAASRFLAGALGLRNAIAFDMGGTTTDVCLIADGEAQALPQRRLGGFPVRLPSVAVESIGAGGGSLARVDGAGALRVGPESAGARPGPACYGLGGEAPTVTDAHAVAGTLSPTALLGETIRVDRARAEAALAPVARALDLGLLETAAGILEVANAAMLRAIRLISVQRGFDLREFALIAYGGAGPLHGGRLAHELGMPRVVVPAPAGVFSALGCVVTEVAYDHVQTHRRPLDGLDPTDLDARFERLAAAVRAPLLAEGHQAAAIRLARSVDVRYLGQNYELEVPWRGDLAALRRDFQALHQRLYAYATGEAMECVNLRVRAAVPVEAARFPEWPGRGAANPAGEHRAYFPETGETPLPVYRRADLAAEQVLKGPALVEDPWATTLVYPGQSGTLDRFGNLIIEAPK
ncbi:MAG: hydantoinase/oxoprolinase family protein [Candidatus Rokubacteria bacterium]|nr:hydantoinase/oxoprolinase family protein [Candidatus Rokubacteria bacterium]